MASERTVTTVTEEKTNKYEIKRGRRSYISEPTSASRDPVARLYSYLERKETLNVPDELQVPNRVVDEEGEEEGEEGNYFGGSTPVSYTHLDVYKRQALYWVVKVCGGAVEMS